MRIDVYKIIEDTVNETILKLKASGIIRDTEKTPQQKTEELLKNYNAFSLSGEPAAEKMILQIEAALHMISEDPYYSVITMYYIEGLTREDIADALDTSVTTVSRNKTRLIKRLSAVLFSDDYIRQLYS